MHCGLNHLVSSATRQPKHPGTVANAVHAACVAARLGYKIRVQSERVKTSHWFVYILHVIWLTWRRDLAKIKRRLFTP